MSFQSINTSSGSVYPAKEILEKQLSPYSNKENAYLESSVHSNILNADTTIWSDGANDLSRLGILQVNGKEIYCTKKENLKGADELRTDAYDNILQATGQDMISTSLIINILQQGVLLDVIRENITPSKNLMDDEGLMKCSQMARGKISVIQADKHRFEVIQEVFMRKSSIDDPEDMSLTSFYKVKVIVSGDVAALKSHDVAKLDFRAMYTKEYKTELEAKKANYFGIKAAGWSHCTTYIDDKTLI